MSRKRRAVAAALAMVAVGAGCGGTHSRSVRSNSATTPRAKAMKFSECMRSNGVPTFPDPDAAGSLTIDAVANGSSLDTSGAAFEQALRACKDLEPSGFTGHVRTPEQQAAALEFAQCVRDNGVEDFPDPGRDDPMVDTRRIPSTDTPNGMSILHAAMQACRRQAADAGVRGGT